jgi:hypothetical protein
MRTAANSVGISCAPARARARAWARASRYISGVMMSATLAACSPVPVQSKKIDAPPAAAVWQKDSQARALVADFEKKFGKHAVYEEVILPALQEKSSSAEELSRWDAAVKAGLEGFIQHYGQEAGIVFYAAEVLPRILDKAKSPAEIENWSEAIGYVVASQEDVFSLEGFPVSGFFPAVSGLLDKCVRPAELRGWWDEIKPDEERIGSRSVNYIRQVVPEIVKKSRTRQELKAWAEAAGAILRLPGVEDDIMISSAFIMEYLARTVKKAQSPAKLKEWNLAAAVATETLELDLGLGRPMSHVYARKIIAKLIEISSSPDDFRAKSRRVKTIIDDFEQRFGQEEWFFRDALPGILEKSRGQVESAVKWNTAVNAVVAKYKAAFNRPDEFCEMLLPKLIARSRGTADLENWYSAVEALMTEHKKSGIHYSCVREIMPKLLEKAASIRELHAWSKAVLKLAAEFRAVNKVPLADAYYYDTILPELIEKSSSITDLHKWDKAAKALMVDYSRRLEAGRCRSGYGLACSLRGYTYVLAEAIKKSGSINELGVWDREIADLANEYMVKFGDPDKLLGDLDFSSLVEASGSARSFSLIAELISDHMQRHGDPLAYGVMDSLTDLAECCASFARLKLAQTIVLDYSQRHGEPRELIAALRKLLKQITTLDELAAAGELIARFSRQVGDPCYYVDFVLDAIAAKSRSAAEFKQWGAIAESLAKKMGSSLRAMIDLSLLIANSKSPQDLLIRGQGKGEQI